MRLLTSIPAVTVVLIALCSGCAARTAKSSACEPVPAEFALAGQPVYRDCNVDRKAQLSKWLPRLSYTPAGRHSCDRAIIDVVVDSTGRPMSETARVVRLTDPNLGLAVLSKLGEMRYAPALKGGRPVSQLVQVDYAVTQVAVRAGTPASSVRPPQGPPPC